MSKRITNEDVKHIANLSKMVIDDNDIAKYQKDMEAILEYVAILDEVNVEGVEPTYQLNELSNVMQEDKIVEGLDREKILKLAKYKDLVNFKTKGVFNNE